jgi:hypothetical protein
MTGDAESKVLLTLEDGVIVAKRYQWVGGGIVGIAALCEDGASRLFAVDENPTYREYYGIPVAPGATYEETRRSVLETTGWTFAEEFPWVETDEKGDLVPGTDTEERLVRWLNWRLDENYDLLEKWGERESSQYAPGFALMWALPEEDVKRLCMGERDLGGPASCVPCVSIGASISELNAAIVAHGLPFLVVDDEGSEEY